MNQHILQYSIVRRHWIVFTLFLLFIVQAMGQGETDNWYYGFQAAMDFSQGSPQSINTNPMVQSEGTAVASDGQGSLLFYSNGSEVRNANHVVMPNGSGLLGHWSATQSATIVQKPGTPSMYYLITSPPEAQPGNGIRYNVIDMTLNGGLGDVIEKNVQLSSFATERVVEVKHANNFDSWIVTHDWLSDTFRVFSITSAGIDPNPVISVIGSVHEFTWGALGYLKASPQGDRVAVALSGKETVEVFDFDNATGQLSNALIHQVDSTIPTQLSVANTYLYGLEFSPDGSKLYYPILLSGQIFQMDLNAGSPAAVLASVTEVVNLGPYGMSALQLGPDEKIYFNRLNNPEMSTIDNPNEDAASIVITQNVVLTSPANSAYGLPNFSGYLFSSRRLLISNFCVTDTTLFAVYDSTSYDSAAWFFGDSTGGVPNGQSGFHAAHSYSAPGFYQAFAIVYQAGVPDTIPQLVRIDEPPVQLLPPDTFLCQSAPILLDPGPFCSYFWQDSSTASTFQAPGEGTYWLRVLNGCGSFSDTMLIDLADSGNAFLGPDQTLCLGIDTLDFDITSLGGQPFWQDGNTSQQYQVTDTGVYSVQVQIGSCQVADTVVVTAGAVPAFSLGPDTVRCAGSQFNRSFAIPGTYTWQDGSTGQSYTIDTGGVYTLTIESEDGCVVSDSFLVIDAPNPRPFLGEDTVICSDQSLILGQTAWSDWVLSWSDGSNSATLLVTDSGLYAVSVTDSNGCQGQDSIVVSIIEAALISLREDTTACEGTSVLLTPETADGVQFTWSDGSAGSSITVTESGTYSVTISSFCGTDSDSVRVDFLAPPSQPGLAADSSLCGVPPLVIDLPLSVDPDVSVGWLGSDSSLRDTVLLSGSKKIVLQSSNTCGVRFDSVNISFTEVAPITPEVDSLCPGEELQIRYDFPADSIRWSTGEEGTVIHIDFPDLYIAEIWRQGCRFIDSVDVVESFEQCDESYCDPFIPNVLTLNGDGVNDAFDIRLDCPANQLSLSVYNRWGNKVFDSSSLINSWKGTDRSGNRVAAGVYFYLLTFTSSYDQIEQSYRGEITILH